MKVLFLILMLIPLLTLSQTTFTVNNPPITEVYSTRTDLIVQQWRQYLVECNTLVPDTIKQSGTVNVKYKPVIVNGEVSHYILSPIDTVWVDCKCGKYKENDFRGLAFSGSLYSSSIYTVNANLTSITYTPVEQINNKININRNKICQIKKRKASWDDFWNRWLVEKKIIELN